MKIIKTMHIKRSVLFILSMIFCYGISAQVIVISDRSTNQPISFATIKINGDFVGKSDNEGKFRVLNDYEKVRLELSHVNYSKVDTILSFRHKDDTNILLMTSNSNQIEEVQIYTGYQQLSAREYVGAIDAIDEHAIQSRSSVNILDRLEGMLSGMTFNRGQIAENTVGNIHVRGLSSIQGNKVPLIILDDFPYEGDLSNIDPQNVENITVLKDAAATSIWGARAGNGVIVITTKKAKVDRPVRVSFNTISSISAKPNLWYANTMSPKDFIGFEKYLFDEGYYNASWGSNYKPGLTPVVEALYLFENGKIDELQLEKELAYLEKYNLYDDLEKYLYKRSSSIQNNIGFQGGSQKYGWNLSFTHNAGQGHLGGKNSKYTLSGSQLYRLNDWLTLSLVGQYTERIGKSGRQEISVLRGSPGDIYPYARLADEEGNPLPIVRTHRLSYLDELEEDALLDWKYYPLNDYQYEFSKQTDRELLLAPSLSIKLPYGFNTEIKYTHQQQTGESQGQYDGDSFFARDLINRFTHIDEKGLISRPVPLGGMLNKGETNFVVHNFRGQIGYNRSLKNLEIDVLSGFELRNAVTNGSGFRVYGYNKDLYTYTNIDPTRSYPTYVTGGQEFIPYGTSLRKQVNRFVSYYGSATVNLLNKYTLMISGRKDASNFFGVNANQRWNPLWSVGLAWDISKEGYYSLDWLPALKLRGSYGSSGNMAYNMVAATTIRYRANSPYTNTPVASVVNYENPDLQWEIIKTLNMGVDFSIIGHRLSGSLDAYMKKGDNLFGTTPIDYTTGIGQTITKNVAGMKGHGVDLKLNSIILDGKFKWESGMLFSFNQDRITEYYLANTYGSNFVGKVTAISGLKGKPVYGMFAYKWAGLDPEDGSPRGYLEEEISKKYNEITFRGTDVEDLAYFGPTMPVYFGSLSNNLRWKGVSLSFALTYKLGHYLRRNTVEYNSLIQSNVTHSDFALRWQKPGDEIKTDIPAFIYPTTSAMQSFYTNATPFVYRASFVRLQYINLAYRFTDSPLFNGKVRPEIYVNIENPGIIWRANEEGLDPEGGRQSLGQFPSPSIYSIGFKLML